MADPLLKKRRVSKVEPTAAAQDHNYVAPAYAQPLRIPQIKNKERRALLLQRLRAQRDKLRKKHKKQLQEARDRAKELGLPAPEEPKRVQRTLENTRVEDVTIVKEADEEVFEDEEVDEFAKYFDRKVKPRILMTTGINPTKWTVKAAQLMRKIIPRSELYRRKKFPVKQIVEWGIKRGYTDLLIWEDQLGKTQGGIDALTIIHLPNGPTARFRITNFVMPENISNHGNPTHHFPELVLNRFDTRLGRTIGRMFAAIFPQDPQFLGRRVVTFHNQRDFIFFRHHRYQFESRQKVRLQELGPRFTLWLQDLQHGTFDTKFGEYEFVRKTELIPNRRTFVL